MNSPEELIEEIRQGRMVILLDDEDRENEGDLIMAACRVDADAVNFMARYGRGLICLTLTGERCERLQLPLMAPQDERRSLRDTSFTISIDAAGVGTGISAADRAATIRVASAPDAGPHSITTPGHIFPLMAQPGGVLTRAGHTEAGCDLARLAGLEPAAVIVEILNEDGSMARRPDLERFARRHGLKLGTVADLIEYRIRHEKTVERAAERRFASRFGAFRLCVYRETLTQREHLALVKGEVDAEEAILVRVHMQNALCDLLAGSGVDCGRTLDQDLRRLLKAQNGVLLLLRKEQDLAGRINALAHPAGPLPAKQIKEWDLRAYGVGAQILSDLGVRKMRLLGSPQRLHALSGFGLEIVETIMEARSV